MFDRALNQSLGQYVWEAVFGNFNSIFQKFIRPREMIIVEYHIYVCYRATKRKKKFIRLLLYAPFIKFDCSLSFDCILYFLTL